jgi:hypothetical protein
MLSARDLDSVYEYTTGQHNLYSYVYKDACERMEPIISKTHRYFVAATVPVEVQMLLLISGDLSSSF